MPGGAGFHIAIRCGTNYFSTVVSRAGVGRTRVGTRLWPGVAHGGDPLRRVLGAGGSRPGASRGGSGRVRRAILARAVDRPAGGTVRSGLGTLAAVSDPHQNPGCPRRPFDPSASTRRVGGSARRRAQNRNVVHRGLRTGGNPLRGLETRRHPRRFRTGDPRGQRRRLRARGQAAARRVDFHPFRADSCDWRGVFDF